MSLKPFPARARKGFTLVELAVVIVIIGVLAAFGVPKFLNSVERSKAAEAFAYDLQAMGRAVVIGEQTGGGAHPFALRPAGHGFVLSLPEGRSINPVTKGDWEGVGVTPDIRVPAEAALERAIKEARSRIGAG